MSARTSPAQISLVREIPRLRMAAYATVFAVIQIAYHAASDVPSSADYIVLSIVGGVLASWLLSVLFRALPLNPIPRLLLVWSMLFVVQVFADLVEGAFFTTRIATLSIFIGGTVLGLVVTFVEALAGLWLFPSSFSPLSLGPILKPHLSEAVWWLRLVVGSVAYFPIYFFFGALVSPLVIPYYTDQSLGLGLVIPSFTILIPIELLRGFLFVLVLVPAIVAVKLSKNGTFIFLALFLYVIGAYVPFVAGTTLPWTLKLYHSLEIFADSAVYSAILTYLFKQRITDV